MYPGPHLPKCRIRASTPPLVVTRRVLMPILHLVLLNEEVRVLVLHLVVAAKYISTEVEKTSIRTNA